MNLESKYHWIPAAIDSNVGITTAHAPQLKAGSPVPRLQMLDLPKRYGTAILRAFDFYDRKILIRGADFPAAKGFQKYHLGSECFHDHYPGECKAVLVNAIDAPKQENSLVAKARKKMLTNHVNIQDSGGFQLNTNEKVNFIDPVDIINLHNKWAHLGVVLDVPASPFNPSLVESDRLAKILALNNDVFLKHAQPHVKLINVNHGTSLKARVRWWEITKNSKIPYLCIGGLRSIFDTNGLSEVSHVSFAAHIAHMVSVTKLPLYHILGASAPWQMILCAVVSRHFDVVITSDSSSWLQMALNGKYYQHNGTTASVGNKATATNRVLECPCKFCHAIKYENVVQYLPHAMGSHNIHVLSYWADKANRLSALKTPALIRHAALEFNLPKRKRDTLAIAIDLVRNTGSTGIKKEYRSHGETLPSLWQGSAGQRSAKRQKKLDSIFAAYSDYHGVSL